MLFGEKDLLSVRSKGVSVVGATLTSIFLVLLTWIAVTRDWFPVWNYVNLIFHEAGHWIWGIFGEMMGFLGGSINQVLIPLICVIVLIIKKRWLIASFCIWWLGQSLISVSIYIGDATARTLDLVGGDSVVHDWYWILGMWGIRDSDTAIASKVWWAGAMIMGIAVILPLVILLINKRRIKH